MKFTLDQERAYRAEGSDYLISAGAGSGKTQVLSERVRFLVEEKGYHIEEFLILTFTKLAAGEMKERIRKKLSLCAPREAERIDQASICTFDSYAFSIVKKYHTAVGLSKNVKMIDENVVTIRIKRRIDEMLDRAYERQDPVLISFAKRYCYRSDDHLKKLLFRVYEEAKNAPDSASYLDLLEESPDSRTLNEFLMEYQQRIDAGVGEIEAALSDIDNDKFVAGVRKSLEPYEEADSLDARVLCLKEMKFPQARNIENKEALSRLKESKEDLMALIEPFESSKILFEDAAINREFTRFIVSQVRSLIDYDRAFKMEHQAFVFSDIAKLSIRILKEHPEIASSIRDSLKTIMIDEYQDTSGIQETFISLISNHNVYMVGDVKQSIYRFRHATPEIFIRKFARYQKHEGGELISLSDNFRSRGEVLDDINEIFSQIMTLEYGGADYRRDHRIGKGNRLYALAGDGGYARSLDILRYEAQGDKDEREARIIAQDIIAKVESGYKVFDGNMTQPGLRNARLSDFCILMDRGTAFQTYQKVFKEYRIPLFVENNVDISMNPVIMSICSLLKLFRMVRDGDLSSPAFRHAYLSFARSFVIEKEDAEIYRDLKGDISQSDLIAEIRMFLKENEGAVPYDLIESAIEHFRIYPKLTRLGDIRMYEKYLDNFISSLHSLHELNFSLEEYVDYFEGVKDLELKIDVPSSSTAFDAVKIMNIFKSKGLEFPVVYCSGLTTAFNQTAYKEDFLLSSRFGIIYPSRRAQHTVLFEEQKRAEKKEDLSEKIRLFYVELTRAKEKIILLLPKEMKEKPLYKATCLGDLIAPLSGRFESIEVCPEEISKMRYHRKAPEPMLLSYEEVPFAWKKKKRIARASKTLTVASSKEALELGRKLHSCLECTDFLHPDYDGLPEKEAFLVRRFLASDIFKGLKNPEFYKEYEFIDEHRQRHGIIDCLIIDGDEARIVDYKLKEIDDDHYDEQLRIYGDFVWLHFGKKPRLFLYSIFQGAYREVAFRIQIQ